MDRRDALKTIGASGILVTLPAFPAALAQPTPAAPLIPEGKGITPEMLTALRRRGERRIYRGSQRFALGMPCGGITAGQLYVLGDGTLGGWHIDGRLNNSGWGVDNYKVRPQPRELIQGFTLLVEDHDKATTRKVRLESRLADIEHGGSYDQIEFIGEYPTAEVRYGTSKTPIEVTLKAGSPFIPLNAKDSALPCSLLRFTLKNTSDTLVRGHLVGFLENGIDKSEPGEVPVQRRNRTFARKGHSAVIMDAVTESDPSDPRPERLLFDFEGGDYKGWEVRGKAFGDPPRPSKGTFPRQQEVSGFEGAGLVNSYADNDDLTGELLSEPFEIDRRFLTFFIGGGAHPGKACVNLLIDGKVVRTATGRDQEKLEPRAWDVRDLAGAGKQARIQIVDAQKGPWGHINADSFRLVDHLSRSLKRPQPDSLTFGTLALAAPGLPISRVADVSKIADLDFEQGSRTTEATSDGTSHGPLVGAVAVPFSLGPGESMDIPFVVAWCFPNLHTGQGQMYSNWFADAAEVAAYVFENLDRLCRETDLFRKTWYDDTTLPSWLASRLFMPTANLATGTAQWWKNGRFWAWEGVGSCHGTCTHVWNFAHAEARLFPDLARSVRVLQDLGTAFEESTGRVAFRGEVNNGFAYAADGQSGTVLKCYREHLCSPDDQFLRTNWPRIQRVLEYQIGRDAMSRGKGEESGQPDGIIETTQHNTFDINFEGSNTFIGSLYLASLLAGARMAELVGDKGNAERYRSIALRGRDFTEKHLFKNGYFVQQIPADASTRFQYGDGCLSDQLFGQNWSRALALGTIYDESKVRSALRAIYLYNWTPAVGQYSAKFPPERWFAEGREGGMFIATWPFGGRPAEPVRYRDEVWTGTEYQAAAGMAWEGLIDESLVVVKAIDDRYDGTSHNPWNEVECGDHYSRAMASYGLFQALCGFTYDGPAGVIGIAPRMSPDRFAAFFSGAEGWGLAAQLREAGRQTNRFEVRWGTLRVATILAEVPADSNFTKVAAVCAGKSVRAELVQDRASVRVHLAESVVLKTGESVEIVLSA